MRFTQVSSKQFKLTLLLGMALYCLAGLATASTAWAESGVVRVGMPSHPLIEKIASDYTDKVIYLDFWASWCAPCALSFEFMNGLQKKYGENGFQVVAVNLDQRSSDAGRFLAQFEHNFPVLFDPAGELATQLDLKSMPSSFIIVPGEGIVAEFRGFRESVKLEAEQRIVELLKLEPKRD